MEKKWYKIKIGGESEGYCTRQLTDEEYKLIDGIFYDCDSEYCGGSITPADEYFIVTIHKKFKNFVHDYATYRQYILTEDDFKYDYNWLMRKDKHISYYICKTQKEAQKVIQYDKLIKNIDVQSALKSGVLMGVDFVTERKELILRYLNSNGEENHIKLNLDLTDDEIKDIIDSYGK